MHNLAKGLAQHGTHKEGRGKDATRSARAQGDDRGHNLGKEQYQRHLQCKLAGQGLGDGVIADAKDPGKAVELGCDDANHTQQDATQHRLRVLGEAELVPQILRQVEQPGEPHGNPRSQEAQQRIKEQLPGADQHIGGDSKGPHITLKGVGYDVG